MSQNQEIQPLHIQSADGAHVRSRLFRPAGRGEFAGPAEHAPSCLILPAMGVEAGYYEPLATALADRGWWAATVDLRGQGESSERATSRFDHTAPEFGYRVRRRSLAAGSRPWRSHFAWVRRSERVVDEVQSWHADLGQLGGAAAHVVRRAA